MLLTGRVLDRALHWGIFAIVVGLSVLAAIRQWLAPAAYPAGVLYVATGGAVLAVGWCLHAALTTASGRGGARFTVAVGGAAALVQGAGRFPAATSHEMPALCLAIGAGITVAGFAFRPRLGLVIAALLAGGFAWCRWPFEEPADALISAGVQLMTGCATVLVVVILRTVSGRVERSLRVAWAQRAALDRTRLRALEQQRWDGLVHDKVLAALRMAGRGTNPAELEAASELAADAQRAWTGGGALAATPSLVATIAGIAHRLDLDGDLDIEGDVADPDTREALLGAVEAAMTNVARHSGQRRVRVRGTLSDVDGHVVVMDAGRGFVVTAPRVGMAGIDRAIVARMERVGGKARIDSSPGQGTTVALSFTTREAQEGRPTGKWQVTQFVPMAMLGGAAILIHVAMGFRRAPDVISTPWLVATAVAVPALFLLLALTPSDRPYWALPVVVLSAIIPGLATLNLVHPDVVGWGFWFVGAFDATVCYLALWGRPAWSVGLALAIPVGIALAQLVRSSYSFYACIDPSAQLLVYAIVFGAIRVAMDGAAAYLTEAAAVEGQRSVLHARLEEARTVASARTQALGQRVGIMLGLVASGVSLAPGQREECLALEAAARDDLVAGPLLTAELADRVRRSREQGARVELAVDDGPVEGIGAFRELTAVALGLAQEGSLVRALWRPDGKGRLGSVSVVSPHGQDERQWATRVKSVVVASGLGLRVSTDADALLFELVDDPQAP